MSGPFRKSLPAVRRPSSWGESHPCRTPPASLQDFPLPFSQSANPYLCSKSKTSRTCPNDETSHQRAMGRRRSRMLLGIRVLLVQDYTDNRARDLLLRFPQLAANMVRLSSSQLSHPPSYVRACLCACGILSGLVWKKIESVALT